MVTWPSLAGIPFSLDFNHRPALGTLDDLYAALKPYLSRARFVVVSADTMRGLS